MLSTKVSFNFESISGAVSLILQNGKLITLSQRVVNDHVDGESKVLYVISSANYTLLKEYNIEKIRFSIYDSAIKLKENFTANNESDSGTTAEEISELED